MVSQAAIAFMQALRDNRKPPRPLAEERADWEREAAEAPLPRGIDIAPCTMGGVTGEWIAAGPVSWR